MGHSVPKSPIEIDIDKWYKVTVDRYQSWLGQNNCEGNYEGRATCCTDGATLKDWIDNDRDCLHVWELCITGVNITNRLIDYDGPYDDKPACLLDL